MIKNTKNQKIKIIVAMSGGVDSSVTAALLQQGDFSAHHGAAPAGGRGPTSGWDVHGVYMKNWVDPEWLCPWQEERRDAMAVATKLGIPFDTWDFSKEYYQAVTEYMIREYKEGQTPNPDVICNREIKFKAFLERALKEGADYIATGHYVRLCQYDANIRMHANDTNKKIRNIRIKNSQHSHCTYSLLQAKDTNKDQSYFLWILTQKELKHCLFPIGDFTKPEVRELARKFELPTAGKKDSQGICFVGEIDVLEFLKSKIPEQPGKIVTTDGKVIGSHSGVQYLTIGQRHGIGAPGGTEPLYVVGKDIKNNRLIVGTEHSPELYRKVFTIIDTSWVSGVAPQEPFLALMRARYRAPLQKCEIVPESGKRYRIICEKPERAVTPGQSVVVYKDTGKGTEMLGGGVII